MNTSESISLPLKLGIPTQTHHPLFYGNSLAIIDNQGNVIPFTLLGKDEVANARLGVEAFSHFTISREAVNPCTIMYKALITIPDGFSELS